MSSAGRMIDTFVSAAIDATFQIQDLTPEPRIIEQLDCAVAEHRQRRQVDFRLCSAGITECDTQV
jgi:hypothetical protein